MYLYIIILLIHPTYEEEENVKPQTMSILTLMTSFKCQNEIVKAVNLYFKSRLCTTIIDLTFRQQRIDELYKTIANNSKVVVTEKKTEVENLTIIHNVRPRRDPYFQDGIITKYCPENFGGFIILANDLKSLKKYSFGAIINPFMSSESYFFIYLDQKGNPEEILDLFRDLFKVFRTPFLSLMDTNCDLFIFEPFQINKWEWGSLSKVLIQNIADPKVFQINLNDLNGFPIKGIVFNSLMAYKIYDNGSVSDYGGVDGLVFDTLAHYMNFTKMLLPNIPKEYFGNVYKNWSVDGSLKYIMEGEIELVCAGYFLKVSNLSIMTYIFHFENES